MINLGSTWNKWNFHVHTKGTNKNDQFTSLSMGDFFFLFFKKAFETQTAAIGITDYFSVDKYLEAVEYRKDLKSKVGPAGETFTEKEIAFIQSIFLFPNVELRMLPTTDRKKLINIHCLFNPEVVSELEDDFFGSIENQDHYKMSRSGITNYGAHLDLNISDDHKKYKKGIDNFVITFDSLKQVFQKRTNLKNNTILVVSNSSADGASGIQKHFDLFDHEEGTLQGFRKSMYEVCHAIFSRDAKDVKYFLGRKSEGKAEYNEEIYKNDVLEVIENRGSLKPCITGCDSHDESTLFNHFTWVKADLSFEGLRQICFEPESRVKIQSSCPDFKEEKLVIDHVKFYSSKGKFSDKPIFLNPNLNVIIGGKSSGKSILLFAIAKTLSSDESVLKKINDEPIYELKEIDEEFDFEITTKSGISQKLIRPVEETSILPSIKYIPQNHLVKLAEPEISGYGDSLNKIIRNLIKEDPESNTFYQDFLLKVKKNDTIRSTIINNYFTTLGQLAEKREELSKKSNKAVLEHNIASNEKKVDELNKDAGLSPEEIEKYTGLQKERQELEVEVQNLRADLTSIQGFADDFLRLATQIQTAKNNTFKNLQNLEIKEYYSHRFKVIDDLFVQAGTIKDEVTLELKDDKKVLKQDTKFREVFTEFKRKKDRVESEILPFLRSEEIQKSINALNLSITEDKGMLKEIEILTNRIVDLEEAATQANEEIFKHFKENYNEYNLVLNNLKSRTVDLEKEGLKIEGRAQFNYPKFQRMMFPISDKRTASYRGYSVFDDQKEATDTFDFDQLFGELKKLFDSMVAGDYALVKSTKVVTAVEALLDDYFFDYWEISYKGDKLGEMSTGKASFVILMLIIGLSKSKAPILIDQPEDNLDNRSITTELVNYLRNKKLDRQIIVVTHNANIVVNADAENVIIASQRGQIDDSSTSPFKFDYINGAIEHSFDKIEGETDLLKSMGIRQHIADIVEGGKEAFIKREQKYRFR